MTDALDILDQASANAAQSPVASAAPAPDALDILDGASTAAPATQPSTVANDGGMGNAFVYGLSDAVPFGNRLTSGLAAAANYPVAKLKGTDLTYRDLYDQAQADTAETQKDNPLSSLAGTIAGIGETVPIGLGKALSGTIPTQGIRGSVNAIPTAIKGVGDFIKGGPLAKNAGLAAKAGNLGMQALRSAAVQAPVGAIYGAGASPDMGDGALAGAAAGAVGGAAMPAIGAGFGKIFSALTPTDAQAVLKHFEDPAEKQFASMLMNRPDLQGSIDNANSLIASGKNLGVDVTPAEALSFNTVDPLMKTQGVLAGDPSTGAQMAQMYQNRSGQIENAYENQAAALHPGQSYDETAGAVINAAGDAEKGITKNLVGKASPLYKDAFQNNQSVSSPLIDRILNTPEGLRALSTARENMGNQMTLMARPDPELTDVARELANVGKMDPQQGGVASGLKLQTLDQVKRAMDQNIQSALASPNKDYAQISRLQALRSGLVGEMDRLDTTATIPAGRDPATGRFTAETQNPNGGSYAQARAVYSGQPDKLAMRKMAGNVADIDPNNPKSVASTLMQGTQKTAQMTANALGPEGRQAAAASIIRNALETNKGAPETIVSKLAPNDRTSDQLATYAGAQAGPLQDLATIAQKVNAGNKLIYGSQTKPLDQASKSLGIGLSLGKDLAAGNHVGILKTLGAVIFGDKAPDPAYMENMRQLIATPKGMQAAQKIADALKAQGMKSGSPLDMRTISQLPAGAALGLSAQGINQ